MFTETDLRSAHVIAQRIASVMMKNTMLAPEPQRPGSQHAGIYRRNACHPETNELADRAGSEPTPDAGFFTRICAPNARYPQFLDAPRYDKLSEFQKRRIGIMAEEQTCNAVHVEVVADVVCGYIGKRRLEAAAALLPDIDVEVNWRPYFLNPADFRAEDRSSTSQNQFGSVERYSAIASEQAGDRRAKVWFMTPAR